MIFLKPWEMVGRLGFIVGYPLFAIALSRSERVRVIIRNSKGQELIVQHWLSDGSWQLPGGGLHRGEDPLLAGIREIREELNLELTQVQIKERKPYRKGLIRYPAIYLTATVVEPAQLKLQKLEISRVRWVDSASDYVLY